MYNDQSKSIITTSDLANFLKLCNHHLIQKYGKEQKFTDYLQKI